MALFQSLADTSVGIVNEWILNSKGTSGGWGQTVVDFWNPAGGLPPAPADGDKYISLGTANGWIINNIYVWNAKTSVWAPSVPVSGTIVWNETLAAPRIWDTVGWTDLGALIGSVTAVPSTDNAVVRFDGITGQVQNSGVLISNTNDITGVASLDVVGDTTIGGKLTVVGLIDPTGLELVPQAGNPGIVAANTIWQDSLNADRLTLGGDPLIIGPAVAPPVDTLMTLSGNTLIPTPITVDSVGNITGLQSIAIAGNVTVGGSLTTTSTENISITDRFLQMNVGYTGPGQSTGLVMTYAGTGISTTTNGAFTPAVPATTDATIATLAAGPLWVAGDLVQVSATVNNDGLYEVQSHSANLLHLRGVGLNPATTTFAATDVTAETIVGATINGALVASITASATGELSYASGDSSSSITYTPVIPKAIEYITPGINNVVIPDGAKIAYITACAAGGGGGSSATMSNAGGGGGGGGLYEYPIILSDVSNMSITIGTGGVGGAAPVIMNGPSSSGSMGGITQITWNKGITAHNIVLTGGGGGGGGLAGVVGGGGGGGGGVTNPASNASGLNAGTGAVADISPTFINNGIYGASGGNGSNGDTSGNPLVNGSDGGISGYALGGGGGGGGTPDFSTAGGHMFHGYRGNNGGGGLFGVGGAGSVPGTPGGYGGGGGGGSYPLVGGNLMGYAGGNGGNGKAIVRFEY